ncbi:NFACT family protein [Helicobacter cinaedi]|uniref:Fibronectin/fibrinogen-binding protein n=1 Tax=Helicobacter cinaedi CCUG 18818 = ATCC BAA-847 TaxID=537971 RepID=A0AAI8QI28_9HELI|nr:NFACT family protein [Helicobacter cinaedi]QOQ90723.1 NFACT family protein [Helicobacter cinaedi]BAM33389.1 fibronectin/fibrinogen-binding protein [Helicobacter cinaedi CCUG 18818 = ATCC BAA-847]
MNLALLKGVERYLQGMQSIAVAKRKDSNLFLFVFRDTSGARQSLYFDMSKAQSHIFIAPKEILQTREFNAPFDTKLTQCTTNAEIQKVRVDGENRILQFLLTQKGKYKKQSFWLMCEFTGKHTNMIICDEKLIVIEALRHIPQSKSWREVKVGAFLESLPQRAGEKIESLSESETQEELIAAYQKHYLSKQEQKKHNAIMSLKAKKAKLEQVLADLPQYESLIESAALYAKYGELLFTHLHTLPPYKCQNAEVEVKDFNGKNVLVPLPQNVRDFTEAGNFYYTQSKKLNKKAKHLHLQQENLEYKINFICDEMAFVERFGEVELFSKNPKLKNAGAKQKAEKAEFESFFIDGYKISVGRNAKENQRLLEVARAEDLWFHIKDVPSSHLIIHCGKNTPPNEVLHKSAEILVGLYIARKGVGDFVVDYTKRRFVKLSQNAQVTYAKYTSIICKADSTECKVVGRISV